MSSGSFTPVKVTVKIEGDNTTLDTASDSDILITYIQTSSAIDTIPEASVGIDAKTAKGRGKLRELFPIEGQGVYYSRITITVVGTSTKLSSILSSHTLFTGYIIGYGHSKAASGSTQFSLKCRGGLHQLSQIILASPGFHPGSVYSWGLSTMSTSASSNQGQVDKSYLYAGRLLIPSTGDKTAYTMYKRIMTTLFTAIADVNTATGISANFTHKMFRCAIEAFKAGTEHRTAVDRELNSIVEVGDLTLPVLKGYSFLRSLVYSALSNPQMSCWDFLLELGQKFGLCTLSIGGKTYVTSFSPLDAPVIPDLIPEDESSIEISDDPFSSPTRAIVTGASVLNTTALSPEERRQAEVALYPEKEELTTQEGKTGVKAVHINAPGFFAYIEQEIIAKKLSNNKDHRTFEHGIDKNATKNVEKKKSTSNIDEILNNMKMYAKYSYMSEKFKQRLGNIVTRYRPDILPGFCVLVKDPSGIQYTGYVSQVTHVVDAQSPSIGTSITLAYIRYGKELDPNPFPNPFYVSTYKAKDAYDTIIKDLSLVKEQPGVSRA